MRLTDPFATRLPDPDEALRGRAEPMHLDMTHAVNGRPMDLPATDGLSEIFLGLGCFWGAERLFWELEGVVVTAVGYQGGLTPNPTYQEVCSGRTGHTEAVRVVYDPSRISLVDLLKVFLESHDPTQGYRQQGDVGTQYRSAVYYTDAEDLAVIETALAAYEQELAKVGKGPITTEVRPAPVFYFAEDYHQQYLHKNPAGYCGLKGTGVSCPLF